jgi:hypothetical protein
MSDTLGLGGLTAALLLLALAGTAAPVRAEEATPLEITLNPTRFTGRMVTVRGTLTNLRPPTTAGGPGVFDVMERGVFLQVLSLTPPPCAPGSPVTVEGRFETMRRVGPQTLTNVIEAFVMTCR